MKPFSPSEAEDANGVYIRECIPPLMVQAVNELLAEKFNTGRIILRQQEVKARYLKVSNTPEDEFKVDWLNFEPLFRDRGWTVKYDKPGYTESYDPYFEFSVK